jgi:uncharacterized membrane protein YhaH (DUF805 family)
MDFTSAIKSGFSNYTNFSGRASRSEYWYWTLFTVIIGMGLGFIEGALGLYIIAPEMTELGQSTGVGLLSPIANLALFIPSLAMIWRRLHDIDKSGAWFFIFFTCVGIIVLFVWYVTKGTAGPNRFGPDPLGSGEALPEPPTSDDGPTLEA